MIDALIFDVDGTIWDTTGVVAKAWNEALDECGLSYAHIDSKRLKGLFGLPMDDIILDILPKEPLEKRNEFRDLCYIKEHDFLRRESGDVYPHMVETFKALSEKLPLFVVSNCQSGYIELMMDKTGLRPFVKDWACYGDAGLLKAQNIRKIVEKYNLLNPLYVGDTQMDANACAEAGIPIAFCSYGFGTVKDPEFVINDISDLCTVILNAGPVDQSLTDVKDPYLCNARKKEEDYLTSFDADRWLAGFRENAGLSTKGAERYGGWENLLIAGHAFGHYIGACALMISRRDVSDAVKEKLTAMLTYIVDELKVCQQNSKGKEGFLFAGKVLDPSNPEIQFDNIENGKGEIFTEAWVPWYTLHKIIQGLLDVYSFAHIDTALEVATGLGDWTYDRVTGWSDETHRRVLSVEYGGMNDCLYELFNITKNERYAVAAHYFDEEPLFERVLKGEPNCLVNTHANTTIPKFIGAMKRYMYCNGKVMRNGKVNASRYLTYATAFFRLVLSRHTYITGGNSQWEHFREDFSLDQKRDNCNNETCNVHNMLKLARGLFEITKDKFYADFYENAFTNAILASQNPETGMTMYFQPMATGYFKTFSEPYTKMWCCTGTGMENFSKLGDAIYYRDQDTVFVNMYLSNETEFADLGVRLEMASEVIRGGKAEMTVHTTGKPAHLDLRLRKPDWAAGEVSLKLNGSELPASERYGYIVLDREFSDGDRVEISIPMKVRAYRLPDNTSAMGFKYGPVVLSAKLGRENMEKSATGVDVTIPKDKIVIKEILELPEGESVDSFAENISKYLVRDEGASEPLTFRLTGTDLVFTPHYSKYDERYGIYWIFA